MIVSIKVGGVFVGEELARQLGIEAHATVFIRRPGVGVWEKMVRMYPRAFRHLGPIARWVISCHYRLTRPRVYEPLLVDLTPETAVLLVDDSVGKGPTMNRASKHLVEKGANEDNVRTAVLQVHPHFRGRKKPDLFVQEANDSFPWDKVQTIAVMQRSQLVDTVWNRRRRELERWDRSRK